MVKPRFLLAVLDDEESVRNALRRLFRSADHDVVAFGSGRDFLEFLKARVPDCLVLDLHLPGLTGLDVLHRLRQEGSRLPVVVITGKDEPGTREEVLASGATAYLVKPLDGQTLLAAISSAVDQAGGASGPNMTAANNEN
jgi:FixJ family two-component response regulator